MSQLTDVVVVTVVVQNPGVTQAGFGVPLVTSFSAAWAERVRSYGNITDVSADFNANTPEYMAMNKIFSQSPCPPLALIGRCALTPTQSWDFAPHTVANNTVYQLRIACQNGSAWTSQTATYTSDSSATNDEIVIGLKAAIDALAAPTVSGVGAHQFTTTNPGGSGSKTLHIVANTAGDFYAIEIITLSVLDGTQSQSDPGIATDLTAINLENDTWYGLITTFNSSAIVAATASWVESNTKIYPVASSDTLVINQALGVGSDIAQSLQTSSYKRTGVIFHPSADEFADAGEVGRWFPIDPGGDNWRMKTLAGVSAKKYTPTQKANLKAKYCNYYYTFGGVNVVGGEGRVASGTFIDVTRGLDWWSARVSERIANLAIDEEKLSYDDDGIIAVKSQVEAQNAEGITKKLIAANPAPVVTVPKASAVNPSDKTIRTLNGVNTNFTLAGALDHINVQAQVSF